MFYQGPKGTLGCSPYVNPTPFTIHVVTMSHQNGLEYTPPQKRSDVLCMTSNCIRWSSTSSGALGSVEYPFIAIIQGPFWPGLVIPIRVYLWVSSLLKNGLYLIGLCAKKKKKKKKTIKKQLHKSIKKKTPLKSPTKTSRKSPAKTHWKTPTKTSRKILWKNPTKLWTYNECNSLTSKHKITIDKLICH